MSKIDQKKCDDCGLNIEENPVGLPSYRPSKYYHRTCLNRTLESCNIPISPNIDRSLAHHSPSDDDDELADLNHDKWVTKERFQEIQEDGEIRRRCKFIDCGKVYSSSTGAAPLKKHWEKFHNYKPGSSTIHTFSNWDVEDKLVRCIITNKLPYSLVDSPTFRDFCKSLNGRKSLPSRHRVSDLINRSIYQLRTILVVYILDV